MSPKKTSTHITLRADETLIRRLRRVARKNKRSMSSEVRLAIEAHLAREIA